MTTLENLTTQFYRRAMSSLREEIDQLGATVGSGATTLSLAPGQTLGSIETGGIIQVDWELFLVLESPAPNAIAVQPGFFDSTTAPHQVGANIIVNPRFPVVDIVEAINQDIDDLSSPDNGLFQVQEITLTYNPVLIGYDLTDANTNLPVNPEAFIDILAVRAHEYGPAQRWPLVPRQAYLLQREADTTIFPSGMAIHIYRGQYPGQPIRITYMSAYTTPLVNPGDDVQAVTGLHPQAHDIPVLGAMTRLMEPREFKRSFTESQPQARVAAEVPVGSSLTAMKGVMMTRQNRIDAERARLERQFLVLMR